MRAVPAAGLPAGPPLHARCCPGRGVRRRSPTCSTGSRFVRKRGPPCRVIRVVYPPAALRRAGGSRLIRVRRVFRAWNRHAAGSWTSAVRSSAATRTATFFGSSPGFPTAFYLKRQHSITWRERWRNCVRPDSVLSCFLREMKLLTQMESASVPHPEWVAAGEDGRGRAFLLVQEIDNGTDLRRTLAHPTLTHRDRRQLAERLGHLIAEAAFEGLYHTRLDRKAHLRLSRIEQTRSHRLANSLPHSRRANAGAFSRACGSSCVSCRSSREPCASDSECCISHWVPFALAGDLERSSRSSHVRSPEKPGSLGIVVRSAINSRQSLISSVWFGSRAKLFARSRRLRALAESGDLRAVLWGQIGHILDAIIRWSGRKPHPWCCFHPSHASSIASSAGLGASPGVTSGASYSDLERYGVPAPRLLAFGQRFLGGGVVEWFALQTLTPPALATFSPDVAKQLGRCLRQLHDASCRPTGDRLCIRCATLETSAFATSAQSVS